MIWRCPPSPILGGLPKLGQSTHPRGSSSFCMHVGRMKKLGATVKKAQRKGSCMQMPVIRMYPAVVEGRGSRRGGIRCCCQRDISIRTARFHGQERMPAVELIDRSPLTCDLSELIVSPRMAVQCVRRRRVRRELRTPRFCCRMGCSK